MAHAARVGLVVDGIVVNVSQKSATVLGRPGPGGNEHGSTPPSRDDLARVLSLLTGRPRTVSDWSDLTASALTGYLLAPPVGPPKMLLPSDSPRAAASVLRLRGASQRRRHHRLSYRLASVAMTAGPWARRWPKSWIVQIEATDAREPSLPGHLGTLLGEPVVVAASLGRRDPHQSQSLIALSRDGRPLAFVKVGWNALNRRLLRNEAGALRGVAELAPTTLTAPSVVHSGCWHELELLLTAPIERKRPRSAPLAQPPGLPVTLDVAATGDRERHPLAHSRYWTDLRLRLEVAKELDRQADDAVERALAAIDPVGERQPLAFAGWHGDWVPWNLSYDREQLLVWDWEYWSEAAPVGFDIVHFFFGTQFFRGGDAITAWNHAWTRSGVLLRWLGVEGRALQLVFIAYALEMLARRLEILAHGGGVDDCRFFPQIYSVIDSAVSAL